MESLCDLVPCGAVLLFLSPGSHAGSLNQATMGRPISALRQATARRDRGSQQPPTAVVIPRRTSTSTRTRLSRGVPDPSAFLAGRCQWREVSRLVKPREGRTLLLLLLLQCLDFCVLPLFAVWHPKWRGPARRSKMVQRKGHLPSDSNGGPRWLTELFFSPARESVNARRGSRAWPGLNGNQKKQQLEMARAPLSPSSSSLCLWSPNPIRGESL